MEKVNHQPYIQHFSHPHVLELLDLQNQPTLMLSSSSTACSGCKLQPSGYVYKCRPCNFTLHFSCTQFPQLVTHPSHPNHTLSLLPISAYPGGIFNCDACKHRGSGFSYHCPHCDFDLHVVCASKPLSITHHSHPRPMQLVFSAPYDTNRFACNVCSKIGSKQWLYRCAACEFDVHMDCAIARPLQHTHASVPARPNYYMHSASTGALQSNPLAGAFGTGNAFMKPAVQGFVEGAAQQVGQTFVQSVISGGSGGGGGDSGGSGGGGGDCGSADGSWAGDSSSTSILGIGSSVLGSIAGDSDTQN
ncbi:hypothetical protein RJ639_033497 [Escallonia herrerae]|uniref:DC1 domain-containing protein n=1 Tax=Escallonia herrerae TaxID=1293975 RepID=A0AA88X2L6_9ASTE|nr:hypothetical protein RJ639_033497 [Escallonia herrerae]